MKNTGQILKEAREKKGISIAEVSLATKINSKVLTAIEQGNLSKLPPKTFLRGFVISYASFLGLDADQILKSFQEEMGSTRPAVEITEKPSTVAPSSDRAVRRLSSSNSSFTKVAAIVGIILLVIVIILLKKKMDSYESESVPKQTPTTQTEPTTSPQQAAADSQAVPGDTPVEPPENVTPIMGSQAPENANQSKSQVPVQTPVATATVVPTPTATLPPKPTPTPAASSTPVASPSPKPSASPKPTPVAGKVQDVTIEALDNVDIEATIDGEARSIHLKAEQVETIKAKRKVSLKLSDGGAVSIIVNGVDRGVPGDLGKPKKVDIP